MFIFFVRSRGKDEEKGDRGEGNARMEGEGERGMTEWWMGERRERRERVMRREMKKVARGEAEGDEIEEGGGERWRREGRGG